jgi:hypothetical protein
MMRGDANSADEYVARQLAEQRITFKAVDALAPEERQTLCLVENAGEPLTTGEQAEFEGETVPGLLLASFGFSTLGDRAALGATIAFCAGGAVLLVSGVFLALALVRSRPKPVRQPVTAPGPSETPPRREMASVSGPTRQR